MPSFSLKRFTNPEALKHLSPEILMRILDPHRSYLTAHGFNLPPIGAMPEIDYERLARVFLAPDESAPAELAEALFFIESMAELEDMDALLESARHGGLRLEFPHEPTPADLVAQVWLQDRGLLHRRHAERSLTTRRSFVSFVSSVYPCPSAASPTRSVIQAMEADLDKWFEEKKRGRGAKVWVYANEKTVWFLIRHGDVFKREGCLQGEESSCVFYRPERFDVVIWDPGYGELRVNAHSGGQGMKDLYRRLWGKHLFGRESFFLVQTKYTLEPLRAAGEAALHCADVPGLSDVRLQQVQWTHSDEYGGVDGKKGPDLFAAMNHRREVLPADKPLTRAVFRISFSGAQQTRCVTIHAGHIATYMRDGDCLVVEEWLSRRGFILPRRATHHDHHRQALDVA